VSVFDPTAQVEDRYLKLGHPETTPLVSKLCEVEIRRLTSPDQDTVEPSDEVIIPTQAQLEIMGVLRCLTAE
jgi:hypothetical protein